MLNMHFVVFFATDAIEVLCNFSTVETLIVTFVSVFKGAL